MFAILKIPLEPGIFGTSFAHRLDDGVDQKVPLHLSVAAIGLIPDTGGLGWDIADARFRINLPGESSVDDVRIRVRDEEGLGALVGDEAAGGVFCSPKSGADAQDLVGRLSAASLEQLLSLG
ncbi:MAG: hypothetical protein JNN07_04410 [Verrucomicrobiales bacterium]|nr:hypothetical protein [Verrucomicrobiales bacterium]